MKRISNRILAIAACAPMVFGACHCFMPVTLISVGAAQGQEESLSKNSNEIEKIMLSDTIVRRIYQDRKGVYWFGTNGRGVIRVDGGKPEYFSVKEGFGGWAVREIVEDKLGNVWFGTSGGITRYDGKTFKNYTKKDGLIDNDVWSLEIDRDGVIWVGTLQGVCKFDGKSFKPFPLPISKPDPTRGVTSMWIVHSILQDSKGKMWFGTNGGAYTFDGDKLSNLSEDDGLCSNCVNDIREDRHGNFWFATHHNGVCRWDGKKFTHFAAKDGVRGAEAWNLFEDRSGKIWFPIERFGIYRYDGKSIENYYKKQGLDCGAVQSIFQDADGRIWVGGWKALYHFDGKRFVSHMNPSDKQGGQ